jgi:hypothetical protein
MLKKSILLTLLLSASSLTFAKNIDSTLTVVPNDPASWRYINAYIIVNNIYRNVVNSGITFQVSPNDTVSLTKVIAMNGIQPKIDNSCNIRIQEEGKHQLLFELKPDWIVYCRYS